MEKTGCKIICGAPTTLAVKGLMMMMMTYTVSKTQSSSCSVSEGKVVGFRIWSSHHGVPTEEFPPLSSHRGVPTMEFPPRSANNWN